MGNPRRHGNKIGKREKWKERKVERGKGMKLHRKIK
jgi:hypothetical protein